MKTTILSLVLLLAYSISASSQFSPEINFNFGIQNIPSGSFNENIEPENTVLYELEIYHPIWTATFIEFSAGFDGSLRRESESFLFYDCQDCPQYTFNASSVGFSLKASTTKTKHRLSLYSGINLNSQEFQQTSYGLIPSEAVIQAPSFQKSTDNYLNLDTGVRLNFQVYGPLALALDTRLYLPLDDFGYNVTRTSFAAGLSFRL